MGSNNWLKSCIKQTAKGEEETEKKNTKKQNAIAIEMDRIKGKKQETATT